MSDLAAFLLTRIAEDEEWAHAAVSHTSQGPFDRWAVNVEQDVYLRDLGSPVAVGPYGGGIDEAQHIVRWDPARVLAECDAKRRIVEVHGADDPSDGSNPAWLTCLGCDRHPPCPTLRLLALLYANHPDYRQDWKP